MHIQLQVGIQAQVINNFPYVISERCFREPHSSQTICNARPVIGLRIGLELGCVNATLNALSVRSYNMSAENNMSVEPRILSTNF